MANLYTRANDAWDKVDPVDVFHPTPEEKEALRLAYLADRALGERMEVDVQRYRDGLISAIDLARLLVALVLNDEAS